jgi:predicted phosphodiesterase
VELGGLLFYLVHSLQDLDIDPVAAGVAVVVTGHSHRADMQVRHGVLYLNPGSAGPRRFELSVTLARVVIADGTMRTRIIKL